ncbi:CBO0543 family protein [Alicyclobacillus acidiphilus]|uniref:CBO0543 family protein n=1 Tax=Alicyclobacillus acidiphilus TaxID=182455 RepID=UPI000A497083|nr:CBO0543 family protein [Alicyclobacillus acidiphilus]
MPSDQAQSLHQLTTAQRNLNSSWAHYWILYSNPSTWQFWLNVLLIVGPLVVLYFALDRKKALLIGFYGFNVHVWFGYIDSLGASHSLWAYPFRVIPFLPISFALDVALVPTVYMLVYQWTINHDKNYYLYATVTSGIFAFAFKPFITSLSLFQMYRWMNYAYLFVGYLVVMLISKLLTDLFLYFTNHPRRRGRHHISLKAARRGRIANVR